MFFLWLRVTNSFGQQNPSDNQSFTDTQAWEIQVCYDKLNQHIKGLTPR